ncbi:Rne/Rng family ribonuclease [Cellulomonas chengniuliangii]|uniref:Rne/Rng family ribonuclease n=1 Tax=Cellulomonas chengniuliangii TaxID=2968084 RepID=UPI001D0EA566|nr:Rne/Rng family ribonuclease [Cellulomonas chengniuliangii]MCC2318186.1 Rne/Rng family ribonuclease [Cellulomonas chengniuliangii]
MTFDITPANSDSTTKVDAGGSAPDTAPSKPARRRATRKTAPPSDGPTLESATFGAAVTSASTAATASSTADGPANAPTAAAEASVEPQPAKAPRSRSRRVTKPAAAAAPAVEVAAGPSAVEPAQPAPAEAPAARATRSRRAVRPAASAAVVPATGATAGDVATSSPAAAAPAAAEPAPARTRSRRSTRPVTAPAADLVAADAQTTAAEAPEQDEAAPVEKPKRTRRARKAPEPVVEVEAEVAADEEEDEDVAESPAAAGGLDVFAELAATGKAPADARTATGPRRGRSRAPRSEAAGDAPQETASVEPTEQARAEQPRGATSRMATTALLFQAPDPDARPRRRRAQAPAGPPELVSEAAVAQSVEEESTDAAPMEAPAAPERPSRRRGRRAPQAVELDEDEQSDVVDQAPADEDLSDVEADGSQDDESRDDEQSAQRRRRRRGGRGRRGRSSEEQADAAESHDADSADDSHDEDAASEAAEGEGEGEGEHDEQGGSSRRRRRRRRSGRGESGEPEPSAPTRSRGSRTSSDEVTALRGSTRLEAKRQRRREGRDAGRRRQIITESEFLARREAVERSMVVREDDGRTQIAVLEDGVLVEHYVSRQAQVSMAGNVYLGRVQNVLPSMEAAFVDVGKGRNAVLYAGEVNWDAAGLEGQPRRIEQALKSGDSVLVQVTKDPIGHKGARLTSQITLAGRYLVYVPGGGMTGISRKLPDTERSRLKKILREIVPDSAGVIVRTAAEGASEDELRADIARLQGQWEAIEKKAKSASAPALLQGEPDMAIRVVRDIFNDDFSSLVVQGDEAWATISGYIGDLAPDLAEKVTRWTGKGDVFAAHRVDEQLAKGMDRKVWLPSGGSLIIERTEAMTVVDVNTGKFTGSGGTLEETVTRNNLEAAEEIVRQLRLRDIGGIIVIDFIDMVLESNRDLVLRRLVECLGRDRTKHQVAEVTSLGLVQMTRKRVGQGLVEAFSETCEHCHGRGFIVHTDPIERGGRSDAGSGQQAAAAPAEAEPKRARRKRGAKEAAPAAASALPAVPVLPEAREAVKATLATIAAAAAHAHEHGEEGAPRATAAQLDALAPAARGAKAPAAPERQADAPAVLDVAAEAAEAPPVLDVLAAFAVPSGEATDVVAAEESVQAQEAQAEVVEALALTPVAPEVFEADGDDESPTA